MWYNGSTTKECPGDAVNIPERGTDRDELPMQLQFTTPDSDPQTIRIPLTQGKFALIDAADLPLVEGYTWYAQQNRGTWYAATTTPIVPRKQRKHLSMHRLILGLDTGDPEVDHKNWNGLDNRRANLRIATGHQNQGNTRKSKAGLTSQYKGVSWDRGRWKAYIKMDGKHVHLGRFTSEIEAARAYNRAALEYFGEFANINTGIIDQEAS